jgi:hypothetical protein
MMVFSNFLGQAILLTLTLNMGARRSGRSRGLVAVKSVDTSKR